MRSLALRGILTAAAFAGLASTATAGVVLSDNFNADAQGLNWSGDATFASLPQPAQYGMPSTDLIGTGFYDFQPGNGNYVDLDGSTGNGNTIAGVLVSNAVFAPGTYTLTFGLAGNLRGAPAQTTLFGIGEQLVGALTPANDQGFTQYSFTFTTASGGPLAFLEEGPSDQQGNLLDNVTLASVPEPASWAMMVIGVGMMGAALRGRPAVAKAKI